MFGFALRSHVHGSLSSAVRTWTIVRASHSDKNRMRLNSFVDIDVCHASSSAVVDWDSDDDFDLFVGNTLGIVHCHAISLNLLCLGCCQWRGSLVVCGLTSMVVAKSLGIHQAITITTMTTTTKPRTIFEAR